MHGRPRAKGGPDPEKVKAGEEKVGGMIDDCEAGNYDLGKQQADPAFLDDSVIQGALYVQLLREVLSRKAASRSDAESLALSAKLLELNPEVYTVWNYRREVAQPVLEAGGGWT